MKRYFLIDLENIGRTFIDGIETLTLEDTLIICHNKAIAENIPQDISAKLRQSKATVKMLFIDNTVKNAMDFCLCTQLGYLLAENGSSAKYYIVSKDKGFDIAMDFTRSINSRAEIKRVSSLRAQIEEDKLYKEERLKLEELLAGHNKKVINITQRCLDSCSTCFAFHNMLQKKLHPQEFRTVYAKVKHLYPMPQ